MLSNYQYNNLRDFPNVEVSFKPTFEEHIFNFKFVCKLNFYEQSFGFRGKAELRLKSYQLLQIYNCNLYFKLNQCKHDIYSFILFVFVFVTIILSSLKLTCIFVSTQQYMFILLSNVKLLLSQCYLNCVYIIINFTLFLSHNFYQTVWIITFLPLPLLKTYATR